MSDPTSSSTEEALLEKAAQSSLPGRFAIYARMSGPGWLQGAITLGGGSLAGALFIGILAGQNLLWIQPFAMLCGIIMLAAIAYVTLSTETRPVETVSTHLNPILAIAWILATIVANIVFCAPQFALATSTVMQNLIPSLGGSTTAPWVIGAVLAVASLGIVWCYETGAKGIRLFENFLKAMVGVVVLSFVAVVVMLIATGRLQIGEILSGYIPRLSLLKEPTEALAAAAATGVNEGLWREILADQQRDRIIAAAGAAVGINMTFLLPYSLLRRGWGKKHREFSIVDLSIGLFVPFVIATSCLVIAAGSQFYNSTADVLAADGTVIPEMARAYESSADAMLSARDGAAFAGATGEEKAVIRAALPEADRRLAAMLASRDSGQLSATLTPVLGQGGANLVFGIGVIAMAWSSIIILILMNGLAIAALCKQPDNRTIFMVGATMPAISGFFAPVIWTGASRAALAIPASVIATTLLPIAYFVFLLLMNSKPALGENRPKGAARWIWNILMLGATGAASFASIWALSSKGLAGQLGLGGLALLVVIGLVSFAKKSRSA